MLSHLSCQICIVHLGICRMILAGVLMECVCNLRMLHRSGELKANKLVHTVAQLPCADTACVLRVQKHFAVVHTH